ncbi:MAG: polysaccharide deacetylase family protein [Verrucomicrobiales bacterium]|nr:polysaccharide deacetylase family protein [Verrucomicrobiales bacterium]
MIARFNLFAGFILIPVFFLTGCQLNSKSKGKGSEAAAVEGSNANPPARGPLPTSVGTKNSYSKVNTSLPFIALTFDDGPHATNTPRLLDILKQRNVKATFYVVATNVKRYPEIMRRIVAEGHEIGNHTVTHGNLTKMSPDEVRSELSRSRDAIVAATGVTPRTMRPPYGAITADQKDWIRREFGYPSILWSVDPEDWKKPGASVVTRRLVSGASPGGILLVHDIHAPTIDAIPSALDQLSAKGFQFVTVTQLIAIDGNG